jgi:hypothetical protein
MLLVIFVMIDTAIDMKKHPEKYKPEQFEGQDRYLFVAESGYMYCDTVVWDRKEKRYVTL